MKLAESGNSVVRKNAAGNPNTPAGVLRELAKDRDWRVRMSVAHNPATSIDVLIKLSKDEDDRVVSRMVGK